MRLEDQSDGAPELSGPQEESIFHRWTTTPRVVNVWNRLHLASCPVSEHLPRGPGPDRGLLYTGGLSFLIQRHAWQGVVEFSLCNGLTVGAEAGLHREAIFKIAGAPSRDFRADK